MSFILNFKGVKTGKFISVSRHFNGLYTYNYLILLDFYALI